MVPSFKVKAMELKHNDRSGAWEKHLWIQAYLSKLTGEQRKIYDELTTIRAKNGIKLNNNDFDDSMNMVMINGRKVSGLLGKSIFKFKITSQNGDCLKVSWSWVFSPTPLTPPIRGISRIRKTNNTKFYKQCDTWWSIYALK